MTEKEIRPSKMGYLVRVTAEQLADMHPVFLGTPESPDAREVRYKAERAKREAEMARLRTRAPVALQPIIEHHAPDEYGTCMGCDGGPDYGGEFPCSTIELIQGMLEDNTPAEHSEP